MRSAEQISRRLKLRHLNVLVAVAEHGSMVKAAERLAVSQPVVSKAIADLEQLVGVRLLERGPHGIEPTVYGHALLKRSAAIFDDLRASVAELESLADPGVGELRIGTTEVMGSTLLPAVIDRLSRQYPRIVFDITIADPVRLQHELRSRRVDLITGRFGLVVGDDLDVTALYHDRLHVVAGLTNPWARKRKMALADLVNERWALPPPDHSIGALVLGAFQSSGLEPPRRIVTVQSALFTGSLLAGGQYLGVLGQLMLGFSRDRSLLKILPVALPDVAEPIRIATLKKRPVSPVTRLFMECLRGLTKQSAKPDTQRRG